MLSLHHPRHWLFESVHACARVRAPPPPPPWQPRPKAIPHGLQTREKRLRGSSSKEKGAERTPRRTADPARGTHTWDPHLQSAGCATSAPSALACLLWPGWSEDPTHFLVPLPTPRWTGPEHRIAAPREGVCLTVPDACRLEAHGRRIYCCLCYAI